MKLLIETVQQIIGRSSSLQGKRFGRCLVKSYPVRVQRSTSYQTSVRAIASRPDGVQLAWAATNRRRHMTALPLLCRPHLQHDPARLPQVPQHVHPLIKRQERWSSASFGLEHDWGLGGRQLPKQRQLGIGQGASRRVVPELEDPTRDSANPLADLQPHVAWQGIGPSISRVHIQHRQPLVREPRLDPARARSADGSAVALRRPRDLREHIPNIYRSLPTASGEVSRVQVTRSGRLAPLTLRYPTRRFCSPHLYRRPVHALPPSGSGFAPAPSDSGLTRTNDVRGPIEAMLARREARRAAWAAWKGVCRHLHTSAEHVVVGCVCCGRVRTLDSIWRVPPSALRGFLRRTHRLSHTYCPDCLSALGLDE